MSTLDFFQQNAPPLFFETVESIMGRLIADVNAGVDPTSALYLDVIPGAIGNDTFQTLALELDRLYDKAANEVPRAGIPTLSMGPWLDSWAEAFGLDRLDATVAEGELTFSGATGTVVDVGVKASTIATVPGENAQTFQTTEGGTIDSSLGGGQGIVILPVVATAAGAAGNVLANTVTVMGTTTTGISGVTNAQPMVDGSDVETDSHLQDRVGQAMGGTDGAGTIDDYIRWFLDTPGVGFVTVQPQWAGPNTVRIMLTDSDNSPMAASFISTQQQIWDPNADGDGEGRGPVGHLLTISTPQGQYVRIAATVDFEDGYSYDGTGGTIAMRGPITRALQAYFGSLPAGSDVIAYKVAAAIVDLPGVANLNALGFIAITTVKATYTAGGTTLVVANADAFSNGELINVIGPTGSNGDTISLITPGIGGATLTIGAMTFNHAVGDVVSGNAIGTDMPIASGDVAVLFDVVLS